MKSGTDKDKISEDQESAIGIQFSQKVMPIVKNKVTSLNDIIPRAELPAIYEHKLAAYRSRFGKEKFESYLKHNEKTDRIRETAAQVLKDQFPDIPAPNVTASLAVALCGVGECNERARFGLSELIKAGCPLTINIVLVLGAPRVPNPQSETDFYEHEFIILGDIPDNITNLDDFFEQVPESAILFDTLLNRIGKARDGSKILKDFIEAYDLNTAYHITTIPSVGSEQASEIRAISSVALENAQKISAIVKQKLGLTEEKAKPTLPEKKDAGLALRKASADDNYDEKTFDESAFKKLITEAKLANSLDKPSGNGNTALHWAIEKGHTKKIQILLQMGADRNFKMSDKHLSAAELAKKKNIDLDKLLLTPSSTATASTSKDRDIGKGFDSR